VRLPARSRPRLGGRGRTQRWSRRGRGVATNRCAAITRAGQRCRADATHGSYCWSHAPEFEEARKQRARKAGQAGGNGRPGRSATQDVVEARAYTKGLISRLLKGDLPTSTAAVAFQGIHALMRVVEMERRIIEQDQLEQRIEGLERRAGVAQSTWPRTGHGR
jgi:hypothetical protein